MKSKNLSSSKAFNMTRCTYFEWDDAITNIPIMAFVEHVAFLKWKLLLFSLYVPLFLSLSLPPYIYIYVLLLAYFVIDRSLIFIEM